MIFKSRRVCAHDGVGVVALAGTSLRVKGNANVVRHGVGDGLLWSEELRHKAALVSE